MSYKKFFAAALALGPITAPAAEGMGLSVRVGATAGVYSNEFEQASQPPVETDGESIYGLIASATLPLAERWAATAALELTQITFPEEDVEATDAQLSVAYIFTPQWAASVGYRVRPQGDGFFNDDFYDESGPFVGLSFGGIELASLVGRLSVAYSFSEVTLRDDTTGGDVELDYDGISLRLGASPKSAPQHSVELRYQRFNGDDEFMNIPFELTEEYLQAYYVYSFTL